MFGVFADLRATFRGATARAAPTRDVDLDRYPHLLRKAAPVRGAHSRWSCI